MGANPFLSADPIGPLNAGSTFGNRYSYVGYDPVNYTDPTGFEYEWVSDALGLGLGTGAGAGVTILANPLVGGAAFVATYALTTCLSDLTACGNFFEKVTGQEDNGGGTPGSPEEQTFGAAETADGPPAGGAASGGSGGGGSGSGGGGASSGSPRIEPRVGAPDRRATPRSPPRVGGNGFGTINPREMWPQEPDQSDEEYDERISGYYWDLQLGPVGSFIRGGFTVGKLGAELLKKALKWLRIKGPGTAVPAATRAGAILSKAEVRGLTQLFGKSTEGAQALLSQLRAGQAVPLPPGVTPQTLEAYGVLAQRAITLGKDTLGVQALRLEAINLLLKGSLP